MDDEDIFGLLDGIQREIAGGDVFNGGQQQQSALQDHVNYRESLVVEALATPHAARSLDYAGLPHEFEPLLTTKVDIRDDRSHIRDLAQFRFQDALQHTSVYTRPSYVETVPGDQREPQRHSTGRFGSAQLHVDSPTQHNPDHYLTGRYDANQHPPEPRSVAHAWTAINTPISLIASQDTPIMADQPMVSTRRPDNAQRVQGIELLSVRQSLPDRFRTVFPYPNFNATQSKCFPYVYQTSDNFVVSSPTGSGKTVIFELAICRVINEHQPGQFKIVYQAPTKSLCAERVRDWQQKFRAFQVEVAELTGDTDISQMRNVQSASIIVTTPEKWDSITRKWMDHAKLMELIKLFLIDEVHMLKDERGATLEAVVSRMKSVESKVRFIALSATVPNSHDIAVWLGRSTQNPDVPANEEHFGEEFRPVKLTKHVLGWSSGGTDFQFEPLLDSKLPGVIAKFSHRKPIMVFCVTRNSCAKTAKILAEWWNSNNPKDQYWEAPQQHIPIRDQALKQHVQAGVAYHHAAVSSEDRSAIEHAFVNGDIGVICCTSTLAVGVNLPCHFVIIKNTVTWSDKGMKEYSDLEIMQMLGRAGRPQYDTSAIAVIMTRQEKKQRYERMVSGEEVIESCLHEHLIDHLNAEINLGTITSLDSAKKWLRSTFLHVRLKQNPKHYRLDDDGGGNDMDSRLENVCCRDLSLLREHSMVEGEISLRSTPYGEAMARYCVQFETAKMFLALPEAAKISEIISAIACAAEFNEIRFRGAEKSVYKQLNKSPKIRFPIPVNIDSSAHKVSLLIQSQLAGLALPCEGKGESILVQHRLDIGILYQHVNRLIRCVIDFKILQEDSIATRNALFLSRSFGAKCWDDSPLQLKQLDKIGEAGVRKLEFAGIHTIEMLEHTESHKIERIFQRNPPFGLQMLDVVKAFPKLRVSLELIGKPIVKAGKGARLSIKAEIGHMNEKFPEKVNGKTLILIFLAETSNGKVLHFARTNGQKIGTGKALKFDANLTDPGQSINCYVMCDEIAGTCATATLEQTIPSIAWPAEPQPKDVNQQQQNQRTGTSMNTSRPRTSLPIADGHDEYDYLDDEDLIAGMPMNGEGTGTVFQHIDAYDQAPDRTSTSASVSKSAGNQSKTSWQPSKLPNGRYECKHKCKDKIACKHLCCKEGHDKPPKPPKDCSLTNQNTRSANVSQVPQRLPGGQTTLNLSSSPSKGPNLTSMDQEIELMDLSVEPTRKKSVAPRSADSRDLARLHSSTQNAATADTARVTTGSIHGKAGNRRTTSFSFLPEDPRRKGQEHSIKGSKISGDYIDDIEDIDFDINPPHDHVPQGADRFQEDAALVASLSGMEPPVQPQAQPVLSTDDFEDADSAMEDVLVGLADTQQLNRMRSMAEAVQFNKPQKINHIEMHRDNSIRHADQQDEPSEDQPKSTGLQAPFFGPPNPSAVISKVPTKRPMPREERDSEEQTSTKRQSVPYNKADQLENAAPEMSVLDRGTSPTTRTRPITMDDIDPWILQEYGEYIDII